MGGDTQPDIFSPVEAEPMNSFSCYPRNTTTTDHSVNLVMAPPKGQRDFQVVVFGATGFTGSLAANYLAQQYGPSSGTGVRWGIAGRNRAKLEAVAESCGVGVLNKAKHIVIADSADSAALKALCERTDVVVACAGPFSRYGSLLVAECVRAGTDYCDITGEIQWVREMIATHDDTARKTGARIVHLCGHDSVPWDLCTLMLAKKIKENDSEEQLAKVDFYDHINSAPSGGTLETAFSIMFGEKPSTPAAVKAYDYDVLLKSKGAEPSQSVVKAKNVSSIDMKSGSKLWHRAFFFMAGVNANAVKRSNALNNYGTKVVYTEGLSCKSIFQAVMVLVSLLMFGLSVSIPPLRWFMRKFVLPKPGEGPSEESMAKGYLTVTGQAKGTKGGNAACELKFFVDPGYKDTARMVVESGLALALDSGKIQSKGGVMTPAACQGEVLLNRLVETGSTFSYI